MLIEKQNLGFLLWFANEIAESNTDRKKVGGTEISGDGLDDKPKYSAASNKRNQASRFSANETFFWLLL